MYDSESNQEVASTELVGVYFNTTKRVSVALPQFVHDHAASLYKSPLANPVTPVAG